MKSVIAKRQAAVVFFHKKIAAVLYFAALIVAVGFSALAIAQPSGNEVAESARTQTTIEGVRIWRSPVRTRVVFDLSAPTKFKYFGLSGPERFVIDLEQAKNSANLAELKTNDTPISGIRGAKKDRGLYRLVLDLEKHAEPEVFLLSANSTYGDRLVVDFYDEKRAEKKSAENEKQSVSIKTVPDKDAKRDIVIALDAGHGGEDPGASGPAGIVEKKVVLQISKLLKRRIDALPGYRAKLIRTGDYYVALKKRRDLAREANADAFISVHADAFTDRRVRGSSVFTLSADGASSASARFLASRENAADRIGGVPIPEDEMLAGVIWELSMGATMDASAILGAKILDALKPVAKLHKSTVEHAGFAVLKSPDMPSVLLETGFISNPKEARKLANKKYQEKLATAVVRGIQSYFEEYAVEGTYVYWQLASGAVERSYKVQPGDTLSGVAERYAISMASLKAYNSLRSDKIRVGQTIKIPPS